MNLSRKKRDFIMSFIFIILFLLGFGLVMIYSTSSYSASLQYEGDGLYYFRKQLISTLVGIVAMIVMSLFPYDKYSSMYKLIYIVGLLFLALIFTPLGYTANGARRWIRVAGFSIQPAEIVKITIIIFAAALLAKMGPKKKKSWAGIFLLLFPTAVYCAILWIGTNNLSSAIIVGGIAYIMLILSSRKNYKAYILLVVAAILSAGVVYIIVKGIGSEFWGFRGERILAWLDPEGYPDGKGFQTLQALYGIGSGGIWGKGLGKSMQKLGFLPEASNDMIFSIICEELGLFGGLAVIVLFVFLLMRIKTLSEYVTDPFANLILCGIFSHIAIQVILNIAVVTNTIPNTGISLPFISYGGSSVIFILAEMGIVINIAVRTPFSKASSKNVEKPVKEDNEKKA